ncbi:MAG: histidinol-phosphatase [Campylobacteraceae bacterium]|jgi:histidinol-phosphatase (PHP family)|nr:histidinol-phosphatase [Campylobacteraceae bacterium]
MRVDLHNHTPLCKHASGTPKEYIQKAIEAGTEYFGFSDHAPMKFDEEYRMDFAQMPLYENMIKEVKSEFQSDINIFVGYEVDFLNSLVDERVMERKVDYFIGSVHFLDEWGFDNPEFIGAYGNKDMDRVWKDYFDAVEKMAKSGLFDIVGHIDLLKIFKYLPKTDMRILSKNALVAIKKADMTIEINTAGFRKPINEQYPSRAILEAASELGIAITFGSDAHEIEHIAYKSADAEKIAREFGYDKCAVFSKRDRSLVKF